MKIRTILSLLLISGILLFTDCGNKPNAEFQKDVSGLGDVMCRIMEVSNKLLASQSSNSMDNPAILELQIKKQNLENEMTILNDKFKKKYGKKMTDAQFVKNFRIEIKKSMLGCKYLSKEDREKYEKEIQEE